MAAVEHPDPAGGHPDPAGGHPDPPGGQADPAGEPALVHADGVRLAARCYGRRGRATLLMVHGFPDTQDLWTPLALALARRGHHVITYDLRGAGASGDPAGRRPYRLARLASDARAVIDRLAGAEAPVHLVGHDWGAIQGWEFLYQPATAPRIASFVCINGACLDHIGLLWRSRLARRSARELAGIADQLRRSCYMVALGLPWLSGPIWRALVAPGWAAWLARAEGLEAQLLCELIAEHVARATGETGAKRERRSQQSRLDVV